MDNLLLTGYPGSGKTTVIKRLLALGGFSAGGFYTEEIREQNVRRGFKIITLGGETTVLAEPGFPGKYRVGRYGVNVEGIEEVAVKSLVGALASNALIVIDEIGKMECCSARFKETVVRCLDGPAAIVATIAKFGDPFIESVKKRSDVTVFDVNRQTRDALPERLAKLLASLP